MQLIAGRLVVSPSDLTGYLACEHLTQLELSAARGEVIRPERSDPELELVSRRGLEHEAAQLARFKARGLRVVEITLDRSTIDAFEQAEARTRKAMEDGVDVIYQGTFFDGRWLCRTDFLLRIDKPSRLGLFGYEVADAKLALKAKARALLQLCAYAEQLQRIQGIESESVRLILGDGHEESYRLKDYAAYYRSVKARFEATVYGPAAVTYPNPVEHCSVCRWFDTCDRRRRDDDHLVFNQICKSNHSG